MHKFIDKIKKLEGKPFVVKEFLNANEVNLFQTLYKQLPIEIDNKRKKILKKKWSIEYNKELQLLYSQKLKDVISEYEMDNPDTKEGSKSLGLFQESLCRLLCMLILGLILAKLFINKHYSPLTDKGETIIFKNRFYGCSTTFSIDPKELAAKGYNKRSSEHLNLYGKKSFDEKIHKKYLAHEDINNLRGLEVALVFKWKLGDLLVFDRTSLHCSSSNIEGKKLGFTSSTKIG